MRWVAVLGVLALSAPVHAQVASDELGIERFRLSIDRDGVLDVESANVPLHKSWSAGVFAGFAHEPLVLYDKDKEPIAALVDRRLTTGLVGSIALWNRLQIGAGVDIVGYQDGSDSSPTMKTLPTSGLGDARLVAKVVLARAGAVQLALAPMLTVPAGSARGYLRDDGVTFAPAAAVSFARESLRVAANVGYRIKPRVEIAGLVDDDELFVRAGVGYALPAVELWWSTSLASPLTETASNRLAIEMMVGASRDVSANAAVFAAGGIGLQNGFGTPDWRALAGVRLSYETQPPPAIIGEPHRVPIVVAPKVVEAKPATVTVTVVDFDKRPIPNVTIVMNQLGKQLALVDGKAELSYPGGELLVEASAPQYQTLTGVVNIAPGTAGTLEIVLVRSVRQGQLRGQVLSFSGKPLAATIVVDGKTIQTDADGQYTIDLPAGTFEIAIESPGHTPQKRTVTVKLDGVTVLNVDLRGTK